MSGVVIEYPPVKFQDTVARARESLEQRDWAELKQRAELLRTEFPDHPDGFMMGNTALLGLGHRDAAEALLIQALERFPDHEQLAIAHAWRAHERHDWVEAKRRWETIKRRFPDHQAGYVGVGIAEREIKLFDEADASFTEAIVRFPDDPTALIEYAWVAHHRGNLSDARRRWKKLRERFPEARYGYLGAGVTEQGAGEFAAAEALLAEGYRRFPADEAIAVGYGWTANLRQDWDTAVARWKSLAQTFPNNEAVRQGLDAALRAVGQDETAPGGAPSVHGQDGHVGIPDVQPIENGVLVGRSNVLFLAEGGHAVLDFAVGRRKVPEESYTNFLRNMVQRHRAATSRGAGFQHIIFPDKHSVCSEDFPVENPILLGMLYIERFPALSHYICYPRDVLRQADRPTFMLTDTHLTDYGTILAVAEIVKRLVGEPQTVHVNRLLADTNVDVEWSGDLGSKLTPPHSEKQIKNPMRWVRNWYHNSMTGGNNGIVDIHFNREAVYGKRLVWFGDSFGRSACQFMSYFFKEVVFFRTPFFHADIFGQIQPDYLVTQNVERYLNFIHSDDVRPSFFMYPYLSSLPYQPSLDFASAMSAVLSYGRKPYSDFLSKIGM